MVHGVPVFGSVERAVRETGCNASAVYVPAAFSRDAAFEAVDAGVEIVVMLPEDIPVQDTLQMISFAKEKGAMILGPNCAGSMTLNECMIGFIPFWLGYVYRPGSIGVVTRSGSLTNEICSHIVNAGMGQTSVIGVGGDSVPGTRFVEVLKHFEKDEQTEAAVLVGEAGGTMEEEVADLISQGGFSKPLVAFLAGRTAPPGKKMGHAGAIVSGGRGSVEGKVEALQGVGVKIASRPMEVGALVRDSLGN
jgi:succinyl-CoA synthetase alpha subunit